MERRNRGVSQPQTVVSLSLQQASTNQIRPSAHTLSVILPLIPVPQLRHVYATICYSQGCRHYCPHQRRHSSHSSRLTAGEQTSSHFNSYVFSNAANMKSLLLIIASIAVTSTALSAFHPDQAILHSQPSGEAQYLIELGPGDRRWITEDEKWALKRV